MESDRGDDRIERLFAAARKSQPYNTNLEYGFETRVMAKIRERAARSKAFLFMGMEAYSGPCCRRYDAGCLDIYIRTESTHRPQLDRWNQ